MKLTETFASDIFLLLAFLLGFLALLSIGCLIESLLGFLRYRKPAGGRCALIGGQMHYFPREGDDHA